MVGRGRIHTKIFNSFYEKRIRKIEIELKELEEINLLTFDVKEFLKRMSRINYLKKEKEQYLSAIR
ncbi:hypothetical protein GCM10026988_03940 [Vibrio panuliri]